MGKRCVVTADGIDKCDLTGVAQKEANRIRTIQTLQSELEANLDRFARGVIMIGLELVELQEDCKKSGYSFKTLFEKHLARPRFSFEMARKYMKVAQRAVGGNDDSARLLTGHEQIADEALMGMGDMQTWEQLLLGFGLVSGQGAAGLEIGGNAALMAWLREHHPGCKARAVEDLNKTIRAEWEAHQADLRAQVQTMERSAGARRWRKAVEALALSAEKQDFRLLDRAELQAAAARLQDVAATLVEAMK
jgi:hypothetical protein